MIFTSPEFLLFILIVFPAFLVMPHRGRNLLLLVASYVFYGWWDWRFLFLLAFSTAFDYGVGLGLVSPRFAQHRKALLVASITIQLTLLGVFKYYDFFAASLASGLASIGWTVEPRLLGLVLPVGISFYTFHTLSYTIDIYRGRFTPTKDFVAFAVFISFFPQLVAGPIARASHLLPQFLVRRNVTLTDWFEGSYLFYWGLFKKVVVADTLAVIVDRNFASPGTLDAFSAMMTAYAFAWQIYGDFSGYTDMARGCSRWFGIDLQVNFNVPYMAVDPSDFWRRWHISLSSMLRDYLYIPLGGSRHGPARTYFALVMTMVLGGLWHGANWTFVLWGLYHGVVLVAYRLVAPDLDKSLRSPWARTVHIVWFFHVVCLGWLMFRAASLSEFGAMIAAFGRMPQLDLGLALRLAVVVPVFLLETGIYIRGDQLAFLRVPAAVRIPAYVVMYAALISIGKWGGDQFIYFQF